MKRIKLTLLTLALVGAVLLTGGCDTECYTMTDGGSIGRNIDEWLRDDATASSDLRPQIRTWLAGEKAKWPVFTRTCETAESCYEGKKPADEGL